MSETIDERRRQRVLKEALQYRVPLMAYAQSLLGNYAAAEDAVQETMLVVVRKYDQFRDGTSMLAWCRSILRLEVLRAKQKRGRDYALAERLLDDAIDAAFEEFQSVRRAEQSQEVQQMMQACLQNVNPRNRDVLTKRIIDGLSYEQIAQRMNMGIEAVRKALFRTKRQVRHCIETKQRALQ